jgi:hypothetical protein
LYKSALKHIAATAVFGLTAVSASAVVVTVNPPGTPVTNQGLVSSITGLTCQNTSFNDSTNLQTFVNPSTQCNSIPYSFSGSPYVSGSLSGQYSALPNNTSVFLTAAPSQEGKSGASPVSISLPSNANYFGFYSASLDAYNFIEFFENTVSRGQYSGTQLAALAGIATGDQSTGQYFNVYLSKDMGFFNKVVLTSTNFAFETDNHSFGVAAVTESIPVPGVLALLSIGLVGIGAASRKQA